MKSSHHIIRHPSSIIGQNTPELHHDWVTWGSLNVHATTVMCMMIAMLPVAICAILAVTSISLRHRD